MKATESTPPIDLQAANWHDVKNGPYTFAVLPWGATEPHNYHLPYLTDCHIAHEIAADSVAKARDLYNVYGMILPTIPLGAQNPGQKELPFCIHTRYQTQTLILTDIVDSLQAQNIRLLILMNGHGGNNFKPLIRDLALTHPAVTIVSVEWFAIEPQKDYFENPDDHAGEMETSVMMHYLPHLVHLSQAGSGPLTPFRIEGLNDKVGWTPRQWNKTTPDTGVGDPSKATAQKGKRYAEAVTQKIAKLLHDLATQPIY